MDYEERKLMSKIAYLEDIMLRSKNMDEVAMLRQRLMALRKTLQKMQWERNEKETHY